MLSTIVLHFGPTVSLAEGDLATRPRMFRAFALVCPQAWGRADWKEEISAVLHPSDLEAAGISLAEVIEAIAFYTSTIANVKRIPIHATPEISAFVIKAPGYRRGPAA